MIKRRTAAVFSWRSFLRIPAVLLIAAVLLFASAGSRNAGAEGLPETARPSVNGRLHVEGTQLTDASGHAVQLYFLFS